ncbi:protease-4 [Chitinophaga skermanii]|uniref:Protease-4 n=1 Tax=Chitinophaga skermanii TaxID=331697 RepID=A0A327QM06_9BACT|nr:signal peptide peptidase SppA [Chitinophaga skermanii]RAJ05291.1 protease-4 [Chitinophaga skermanii]
MRSFLKIFFASLLAMIVFTFLGVIFMFSLIGKAFTTKATVISPNGVLVVDLSDNFREQANLRPFASFTNEAPEEPGLYDVVSMIRYAAQDGNIKGIYLKTSSSANGFASTEEIRNALIDFKKSKKFIYAYAETMSQQGYYVASVADKVFLNPQGGVEFNGFNMTVFYLKNALQKLEVEPQIFYDGKFKSATEPLRETKMTDANRVQTTAFLNELYGHYLKGIAEARKLDSATLHSYAQNGAINFPQDAVTYKLVDGLQYNDQVMDLIKKSIGLGGNEDVNFISLGKYHAADVLPYNYKDAGVALVFASGDIKGGTDEENVSIASEDYIKIIRDVRNDDNIKAVVFRVNSGGGSALASEVIWREIELTKKKKPVVVSMGDYAASGGYYIACNADAIFAEPNTLTGSIGVFAVLPNMQGFFNNKLGVTFDGVKTAQYADMGSVTRPLTENEKRLMQSSVDSIYSTFKSRVVAGRKLAGAVVDSIAQGRVWSGTEAKRIGLVDQLGGIEDALKHAAKLANLPGYRVEQYPELKNPLSKYMKTLGNAQLSESIIAKELGTNYAIYKQLKSLQAMKGEVQARLPYDFTIQ